MIVPDLERMKRIGRTSRSWDEDEEDTLIRYYKRVPPRELIKYLHNRSVNSLRSHKNLMEKEGRWNDNPEEEKGEERRSNSLTSKS
jgi:hypothetical protein